jgi:hypothetical protein
VLQIRQPCRQQSDGRQERANPVDELDAGPVGQLA